MVAATELKKKSATQDVSDAVPGESYDSAKNLREKFICIVAKFTP